MPEGVLSTFSGAKIHHFFGEKRIFKSQLSQQRNEGTGGERGSGATGAEDGDENKGPSISGLNGKNIVECIYIYR